MELSRKRDSGMDLIRSIFFQHTLSRNRFTRTWIHNHTHTNKYLVYLSDQFLYSTPIFCVVYVKPIASKVIEFILKWLLIHKQITAYSTKIQKYTPTHTLPHTCYTYINSYRVQPCTLASRQPTKYRRVSNIILKLCTKVLFKVVAELIVVTNSFI